MSAVAKQEQRKQLFALKSSHAARACLDDAQLTKRRVAYVKAHKGFAITRVRSDPEKEQMAREIASLRSTVHQLELAVSQLTTYVHQNQVHQAPAVSFLDEMMASLEAKLDAVRATEPSEFSQSFVDDLLSED